MAELPKLIVNVKLWCPHCGARHVDEERNGEKWHRRAHTTHRCQSCGGDFDVYVSGMRDDVVVAQLVDSEPPRVPGTGIRMGCGHLAGAHPEAQNYTSGAAERDGRICSLGWPL